MCMFRPACGGPIQYNAGLILRAYSNARATWCRNMTIGNMKQVSEWASSVDLPDFEQRVIQASHQTPVLVDLWAQWCSPCLIIAPVLIQVVEEYAGRVLLVKVEVDAGENMKLAGQYRVKGFPTVILFDQGEERGRFSGAQPPSVIRDLIEQNLQSR